MATRNGGIFFSWSHVHDWKESFTARLLKERNPKEFPMTIFCSMFHHHAPVDIRPLGESPE